MGGCVRKWNFSCSELTSRLIHVYGCNLQWLTICQILNQCFGRVVVGVSWELSVL